jgi:hypothetical protein
MEAFFHADAHGNFRFLFFSGFWISVWRREMNKKCSGIKLAINILVKLPAAYRGELHKICLLHLLD